MIVGDVCLCAVHSAAHVHARTGGIERLRHCIDPVHKAHVALFGIVVQFPPRLVEGTPRHDAGMVEITLHRFPPFADKLPERVQRKIIHAPARILAPNEEAALVAFIEVAGIEQFLMQARAVEAQLHRPLNVRGKLPFRCGGVHPFGIIPLVEHQPLEHRFSVEQEVQAAVLRIAQAEIGIHRILPEAQHNFVQISLADFPEMSLFQRQGKACRMVEFCGIRTHDFAAEQHFRLQVGTAVGTHFYLHTALLSRGIKTHGGQMRFGDGFQPHALPDPRAAGVKTAERIFLGGLLARRVAIGQIVAHVHFDVVFPFLQEIRHVHAEGRVGAPVAARLLSVDKYVCNVADGAEAQEHPVPAHLLGQDEGPAVAAAVDKALVPHAGKLRFHTVRHADLLFLPAVENNVPLPVQEKDLFPRKLRLGMFFGDLIHILLPFITFAAGINAVRQPKLLYHDADVKSMQKKDLHKKSQALRQNKGAATARLPEKILK